jgi:hypothetical protein
LRNLAGILPYNNVGDLWIDGIEPDNNDVVVATVMTLAIALRSYAFGKLL